MNGLEWAEKRGVELTPLQRVNLEEVLFKEAYCNRCQQGADIPCLGVRPVFNEQESDYYGTLRISGQECPKSILAHEEQAMRLRMQRSGIPNPEQVDTILNADTVFHSKGIDLAKLKFGKTKFTSGLLYTEDDPSTAGLFSMLTVLCVREGYNARYVDPYITFSSWDMQRPIYQLTNELLDADILFARRIDRETGADFKRKALMQAIYGRMSQGKITVVSLTAKPNPLTDDEKELFEEIRGWQRFQLK